MQGVGALCQEMHLVEQQEGKEKSLRLAEKKR